MRLAKADYRVPARQCQLRRDTTGGVDSRPPRRRVTLALPLKPFSRLDQTITLVVLAVLIAGCFLVLQPFLTAILWAGILCATTWPLYQRLVKRMRGRESLAAATMVTLIALSLLTPFVVVGATIADNAQLVITHYQRLLNYIVPDFVHVLVDGRIVRTGGKQLALELEEKGYDWITREEPVAA